MATIDIDCFKNKSLAKIFLCTVCKGVTIEPLEHTGQEACEAIYCSQCVTSLFDNNERKCAITSCKAVFDDEKLAEPKRSTVCLHSILEFRCPYCEKDIIIQIERQRDVYKFSENNRIYRSTNRGTSVLFERVQNFIRRSNEESNSKAKNNETILEVDRRETNLNSLFDKAADITNSERDNLSLILTTHSILQPHQNMAKLQINNDTTYITVTKRSDNIWGNAGKINFTNVIVENPGSRTRPEATGNENNDD